MARQPNATPPKPAVNGHDAEIEIADGVEVGGDAEVVVEESAAAAADPGIEDLRKQLEAANLRTQSLERERDQLAQARQTDQREVADHRLLVIDATISEKETNRKDVLSRIKLAKEAGDYDAEVTALAELTEVTGDIRAAKLGKSRLENEIEDAKSAPAQDADRLEQYIKDSNMHPKSATWLRNHRDYAEDSVKNAELVLAHQISLREGHALNSDAYFASLEKNLGMGEQQEQQEEVTPTPQRQAAAPAAPVSRSAGLGGGGKEIARGIREIGNGKYRVSPEIAEAAAMSGISVAEYIEQAKKLVRGSDGQLH